MTAKRAEAQSVLNQIQGLDANLSHAIEAYNLANEKLAKIQSDLQENRRELKLAQRNLGRAQTALSSASSSCTQRGATAPASRC